MLTMSDGRRLKPKDCVVCGGRFNPTGRCAKFCDVCRDVARAKTKARVDRAYEIRSGRIKKPGAGTGGNQRRGAGNPAFKADAPHRYRDYIKDACERCGSTRFLTGHHKNRRGVKSGRPDNRRSNIETLCKSCHQKEHKAHLNFTKKLS